MSKSTGWMVVVLLAAILGVLVWVNVVAPANAADNDRQTCNATRGPLDCALHGDKR